MTTGRPQDIKTSGTRAGPKAQVCLASCWSWGHAKSWPCPASCRCWVCSPMVRSILVMGYGGLTSLFNLVVLAWALWILCRLRAREKAQSPWAYRDTVMVLGLTVLLGTTWALAFFSFGVFLLPQLFLFTIFNSLYGKSAGAHRAADPGRGLVTEVQGWMMAEPTAPFKLI